jgi:hypothetical protein
MKCESCTLKDVETEEPAGQVNPPYFLCAACRQRLLNYALRPIEFFNLSAIHGHNFYLHDDFYDYETGEAVQPKEKVIDANLFPFPKLRQIKGNLHKLVDYACVEYFISPGVIELLEQHDKRAVLIYLMHKVKYNRAINYKAYEIAAKVLANYAGEWIKNEWELRKENEILLFAEAITKCLDLTEAFYLLTTEIEASDDKKLLENSAALLYFQDSRTLDWIEKISQRIVNVSTSWGVLAAASRFSWQRAEKWLAMGRPLSLIGLDALIYCTTKGKWANQALWLREHPPVLVHQPATDIIVCRLNEYLRIDNTARTRSAVDQIGENLL